MGNPFVLDATNLRSVDATSDLLLHSINQSPTAQHSGLCHRRNNHVYVQTTDVSTRSFGRHGCAKGSSIVMVKNFPSWYTRHINHRKTLGMGIIIVSGALFWVSPPAMGQEPSPASNSTKAQTTSSLAYVSDFFSFVGRDASGRVAFVLDSNRGRDGDTWQAEHLVVLLHSEQEGWQELKGSGTYENKEKKLDKIPNSPFFEFQGDPTRGLTIKNSGNQLTLEIRPIKERVSRKEGDSHYRMGSASGTMTWQGRTLDGWVIHERLTMADFNRLTHQYFDLWTESYGVYAWAEDSPDFLYFHKQANETRLTPLVGNLVGFGVFTNRDERLQNLQLTVVDSTQAWGFYQWPRNWKGQWIGRQGPGSIAMQVSDLQVISNFILGGLAMGIIQGEITYNGKTRPIYGMAELLF